MTFTERENDETLASHMLRNASHLGLSEDHRSRLLAAFRLEQGPHADRVRKGEALTEAARLAEAVRVEAGLGDGVADAAVRAASAQLAGMRADRDQLAAALATAERRGDVAPALLARARARLKATDRQLKAATTKARDAASQAIPSARYVQAQAAPAGDGGAKRIKARDGLASLLDAGALTEQEAQVGLAYRLLYEQAGPGAGLGSQLEDRPRAVRDSSHGAVAFGLLRAYAGVRLTGADQAVQHADPSGRALAALRAVAGEGRTIRSLGDGGNTKRANLEALKLGLRIALAALKTNGGLRIGAR